ncbi:MAG: prenyltransferase/squalene oxidase repeat-containing protein [Nitrososphaerales archaeon]
MKSALEWLLEKDQPSIRYLALKQLMGKKEKDPEVVSTRNEITKRGWAQEILAKQEPGGWWVDKESLYLPKYLSTNWMLLILSDLGLTKREDRVEKACNLWIRKFAKNDGGFAMESSKKGHVCTAGNMARALVNFGYDDHQKVESAFEWLAKNSADLGGWSCFGSGRNLDSWEPLSAFAVYPKEKWTRSMKNAVEKGAEFFLERELHIQGDNYNPWYRFHYPVHYYYDLLVGLDFMTALGYGKDRRMGHAIDILKKRRNNDGTWNLDAVHPDVEGGMGEWYAKHPKQAPTPFALEAVGEPSKMITLKAMQVLERLS